MSPPQKRDSRANSKEVDLRSNESTLQSPMKVRIKARNLTKSKLTIQKNIDEKKADEEVLRVQKEIQR